MLPECQDAACKPGHCRQHWDSAGKVGSCRQNPNGFRQHPGVAGSPRLLNNSCRGMARYPNYSGRIRSCRQLPVENAFLLMHWKHDPVPRRMHDSYCEIRLPFASSPVLLENYTNASGGIRTGLLMEHLDSLAGSIGYKHMLGPEAKELPHNVDFYIVTASVERYVRLFSCWLRSCSR